MKRKAIKKQEDEHKKSYFLCNEKGFIIQHPVSSLRCKKIINVRTQTFFFPSTRSSKKSFKAALTGE
jgi:hypothetical protein